METKSQHELLATICSDLRHIRDKGDELCERIGKVEAEIIGEIGDPARPSIRRRLENVESHVKRSKARGKWWAGIASGALLAGLGSLIDRLVHRGG